MTIQEAAGLVKLMRSVVDEYGFRAVLSALERVAKEKGGAAWGFLGYAIKSRVLPEVPSGKHS